ncbi:hypothetical protein E3P98_01173 [Wallemia ichthyophaga]|nr:hypothetical protein E3P98_01173 [Wallemia ichthyophaga]
MSTSTHTQFPHCPPCTHIAMDLAQFEKEIAPKTFVNGHIYTTEDLEMYKKLHPSITQLQGAQLHALPNTVRYFSLLQNLPPARKLGLGQATFDFTTFPTPVRVAEAPKEKKPKKEAGGANEGAAGTSKAGAQGAAAEGKKEKAEKPKKEKAAPAPAAPVQPPSPHMIDLRVGKIVKVDKHPDADSLYVEQIDLGTETRIVVSGLVKYVPIEEMQDKMIVAICNLKPASMRGIKSFAMVLCATSSDGKDGGVEFVNPPEGSAPGDRIYFEGYEEGQPESQLNPKKKVFETIQPGFRTLDTLEACWINPENSKPHLIKTDKGETVSIHQTTMESIERVVLEGGDVYTDTSGLPGVGRTRIILSSVKEYLNQQGNEKAYALIIDTNGDLNLHDTGDDIVMEPLPGYIDSQPFDIKLVAIDTISNYIRYPDIKQSEKMSVMSSLKKTINKLNTEMAVKVLSTSDAILRKAEDASTASTSSASDQNHYIGGFFGSHFYQSLRFRQLQIYYEPGNSHTRIMKVLKDNSDTSYKYTIDFAQTLNNTLFKRNSTYVASIFVGTFAFGIGYDVLTTSIWDKNNAGKQWPDVRAKILAAGGSDDE